MVWCWLLYMIDRRKCLQLLTGRTVRGVGPSRSGHWGCSHCRLASTKEVALSLPSAAKSSFVDVSRVIVDPFGLALENYCRRFQEGRMRPLDRPFAYARQLCDMAGWWLPQHEPHTLSLRTQRLPRLPPVRCRRRLSITLGCAESVLILIPHYGSGWTEFLFSPQLPFCVIHCMVFFMLPVLTCLPIVIFVYCIYGQKGPISLHATASDK